jgi:hypothetical protein
MRRYLFRILVILSLGGVALLAADFWQKKKFPDWNRKEVQKMLTSSPWARQVKIPVAFSWRQPAGDRSGRSGRPRVPRAGSPGGSGGSGGRSGGSSVQAPQAPPTQTVLLRWHSALPVKQAVAKARFGDEVSSSPEAAKSLGRQETAYVLGVIGLPARAVAGDPAELKSNAVLRIKKKPPIPAADIRADREQRTVNLFLFFPRGRDGHQPITLEDREVEFLLKIGRVDIKRKFKLKDMVYEGKLEI